MALSEEHGELATMIEQLQATLDRHITVDHAGLLQRPEVEEMVSGIIRDTDSKLDSVGVKVESVTLRLESTAEKLDDTANKVGKLVAMWKGPIDDLTGDHRHEDGLEHKVNQILEKIVSLESTGGLKKKERTTINATLLGTIITTIGVIVVAWFEFN